MIKVIRRKTKEWLVYYFKNIKKLDYYTITIDGKIESYVFSK